MTDRLPVVVAQDIAASYGQQQVIVVTWDGTRMHCCTFGASTEDADQAAQGGDLVKRALGWPESLMGSLPSRVQAVQDEVNNLTKELESSNANWRYCQDELGDLRRQRDAAIKELQELQIRDEQGWKAREHTEHLLEERRQIRAAVQQLIRLAEGFEG